MKDRWSRGQNKYRAKKTDFAGHRFDSNLEANTFGLLKLREKAGEISDIKRQVHVYLTRKRILIIPDFSYIDKKSGLLYYGEAKGFVTAEWKLKRRLWEGYGPAPMEVYVSGYPFPYCDYTIIPEEKCPHCGE